MSNSTSIFTKDHKSPEITSKELAGVSAVIGEAVPLEEKPVTLEDQKFPSLYERSLKLTVVDVLRGDEAILKKETPLFFTGFTIAAPSQRHKKNFCCLLDLNGQTFFESSFPKEKGRVLLLIGAPALTPARVFGEHSAVVESGSFRGQPVRAFLLKGLDAELDKALPYLLGWQQAITLDTVNAAIAAPHPLVALDGLRLTIKEKLTDFTVIFARHLLFPTQLSGIRTTTTALIAEAITRLPEGSKEAETLIDIILNGWEAERIYPVETNYLKALQSIIKHITHSRRKKQIKAVVEDYHKGTLSLLYKQLSSKLKG